MCEVRDLEQRFDRVSVAAWGNMDALQLQVAYFALRIDGQRPVVGGPIIRV